MDNNYSLKIREVIIKACKPLIKVSLMNGITAKEFNNAINSCFVSIATADFGIKGRPANISRVAVLTGLSRKEIKRIKDGSKNDEKEILLKPAPIARILAAWHNDSDFLDGKGRPKALTYDGEAASFEALAKRYIGDIPTSALLKELERNELVVENMEGKIKPIAQAFISGKKDFRSIDRLGEVVGEIGGTIVKNLMDEENRRFERRVLSGDISPEETNNFHKIVEQQGGKFLEFLESWLFENGLSDVGSKSGATSRRAGVGVYFFEERRAAQDEQ